MCAQLNAIFAHINLSAYALAVMFDGSVRYYVGVFQIHMLKKKKQKNLMRFRTMKCQILHANVIMLKE